MKSPSKLSQTFLQIDSRADGHDKNQKLLLSVYAQPGARKTCLAGQHGEALKIRIHAPPVDGQANEELISYLSEILGIAKRNIELVRGATSRSKQFRISQIDFAIALAKIESHMLP